MPVKFSKSFKEYRKGSSPVMTHDYIKSKSKEELFSAINEGKVKPKIRRKAIVELERRGTKLVWVPKPKDILD